MYSLKKAERLRSRKLLDELIRSGKRINHPPISTVFMPLDNAALTYEPVQVAFSVPKRYHKKAVSRNRIKRLLKEAYRLNKANLVQHCLENNVNCIALFVYNSSLEIDFQQVQTKIILTLDRLIKVLGKPN